MPKFQYAAAGPDGGVVSGTEVAGAISAVHDGLIERNLVAHS